MTETQATAGDFTIRLIRHEADPETGEPAQTYVLFRRPGQSLCRISEPMPLLVALIEQIGRGNDEVAQL